MRSVRLCWRRDPLLIQTVGADYQIHTTDSHPNTGRAHHNILTRRISLPRAFHDHVWSVEPGVEVRYLDQQPHKRSAVHVTEQRGLQGTRSNARRQDTDPLADCSSVVSDFA